MNRPPFNLGNMAVNEPPPKRYIRHRLKDIPKETLAALYQSGQSLEEIGRTFGVTKQAVYKALKARGIARRTRSKASVLAFSRGKYSGKSTAELNESLFSDWSQSMAYLLGYIFTDGCLTNVGPRRKGGSRMGLAVKISSTDRDHLEKLADVLGKGVPIDTYKQGKRGFSGIEDRYLHHIQFTRPRMIEDLRKLGLTKRKSLTMKFPPVPEEFLADFIRGCWDGDGSIFINKQTGYPRAYFGTGSLAFIREMSNTLRNLGFGRLTIHLRKPDMVKTKNPHYYIQINHQHAVKFCEFLYDNAPTGLMLLRKALVYEYWLGQHPKSLSLDIKAKRPSRLTRQRCRNITRGRLCALPALPEDVYCGEHQKVEGKVEGVESTFDNPG